MKENKEVVPIFIFDTTILDKLEDKSDRRVEFIHHLLTVMQHQLTELGKLVTGVSWRPTGDIQINKTKSRIY
ncbi:MAG: hypothetical protein U5K54_04195 [Cytophagales bacterium]|nr:hypothetical protein [Cytophagales bacterium]